MWYKKLILLNNPLDGFTTQDNLCLCTDTGTFSTNFTPDSSIDPFYCPRDLPKALQPYVEHPKGIDQKIARLKKDLA